MRTMGLAQRVWMGERRPRSDVTAVLLDGVNGYDKNLCNLNWFSPRFPNAFVGYLDFV